jgi:tetratricopeptide (TPR) repeat protein
MNPQENTVTLEVLESLPLDLSSFPDHSVDWHVYQWIESAKEYEETGELKLAIKVLSSGMDQCQRHPFCLYQRGLYYARLAWYRKAADDFRECIFREPKFVDMWHSYGYAMARQGNHKLAIAAYTKLLECKPEARGVHLLRAASYMLDDKITLAMEDIEIAKLRRSPYLRILVKLLFEDARKREEKTLSKRKSSNQAINDLTPKIEQ